MDPKRIKVLVVDDSIVIRKLLQDVLSADPAIEVSGVAAHGRIALSMIELNSPDAVTLDVEMPVMDGIETLKAIRAKYPRLPVIMFSTTTELGAAKTIECLTLGASDYVTKPANVGSFGVAKERIAEQLIPKIKALCHATDSPASASSVPAARVAPFQPVALPRKAPRKFDRINVVVIGSSTGGPNALAELVAHVGEDFPVPILIVQHMPPTFTHFFAKRLDSICGLKVREAGKEERLCAGQVWIAPGDYHITVDREGSSVTARTNQLAHENSCRPSVDVLFRAVARVYGSNALAVVLTGMGQDGLLGCEALSAAGAQIVVQDEKTSVVWGMPGFVAKAGLADAILPLSQIGPEILSRVRSGQQNASSHSRVAVGGK